MIFEVSRGARSEARKEEARKTELEVEIHHFCPFLHLHECLLD